MSRKCSEEASAATKRNDPLRASTRSRALAANRAAIGSAAVGLTNSSHTRPYSRASARSLQERLTSCRRQRRPTVTSEARVGPFVQHAFLETNASQASRPSRPLRWRTRFGSTIFRSDCVLQKTGPTRNQPKSRGDPGSEEVRALSSRPRRTLE